MERLEKDEVVVIWGGIVVSLLDFKSGRGVPHTNVGIEEGLFLAAADPGEFSLDDFMNHSCEPNLGLRDEITLVARRAIRPGEELTIDYCTEVGDEEYVMGRPCDCGSPTCRKRITGKDWRLEAVQTASAGYFSPFISRRIAHSGV